MITKINSGIVIVAFGFFLWASCSKFCGVKVSPPEPFSLASGYSSFTPDKDSIGVGDTFFININVPERLNSSTDNSTIDFSNANNMIPDIGFSILKGWQSQEGALDSFVLFRSIGSFSTNSLLPAYSVNVAFNETPGSYQFSAGCIAQKKGIYLISVSDIPYANKKCTYAKISVISSSSDSHLHYLKDIYYSGGQISQYDSTHSYCFKVH